MKKQKTSTISCTIVLFITHPLTGHNLQTKVNWTPFDFIAIVLLIGSSVLSELILRKNHNNTISNNVFSLLFASC
jgi:predicted membrane channel-forming protein YqfA (hemolysin III family)